VVWLVSEELEEPGARFTNLLADSEQPRPRLAGVIDAAEAARLLHDFNTEFEDFTPGVQELTNRLAELLVADEVTVLLAGDGPLGIAVLRFRPALWTQTLDAYLEELYVVPQHRGEGLGRALLEGALELARSRGAGLIHLGTSVDDRAAIALYEKLGFTNREGAPDGPVMLFYEREL
jgi:ribosomal protein S18 acetylase RimI-like enzyme